QIVTLFQTLYVSGVPPRYGPDASNTHPSGYSACCYRGRYALSWKAGVSFTDQETRLHLRERTRGATHHEAVCAARTATGFHDRWQLLSFCGAVSQGFRYIAPPSGKIRRLKHPVFEMRATFVKFDPCIGSVSYC